MNQHTLQIACRRDLVYKMNGRALPVSLKIYVPTKIDAKSETDFTCTFEIDGLGSKLNRADNGAFTSGVKGVDSTQALILAFRTLQLLLKPHEASLSWLTMPGYHGIPLVIDITPDFNDEFRRHIEDTINREIEIYLKRKLGKSR